MRCRYPLYLYVPVRAGPYRYLAVLTGTPVLTTLPVVRAVPVHISTVHIVCASGVHVFVRSTLCVCVCVHVCVRECVCARARDKTLNATRKIARKLKLYLFNKRLR